MKISEIHLEIRTKPFKKKPISKCEKGHRYLKTAYYEGCGVCRLEKSMLERRTVDK